MGTTTKTAADTAQDKGAADLAKAREDLRAARAQVSALTKDKERLTRELGTATAERDQARADLDAATKAVAKGKADLRAAKAKAAPKPPKLRAIGPVEGQPVGQDLLELIGAADTVELVFSNGKTEVRGVPSQLIEGDAWKLAANGVRMTVPQLVVHGPGHGQPPIRIAGYGLLLEGEQVAYAPRIDVLDLLPNMRADLKDDVIFN